MLMKLKMIGLWLYSIASSMVAIYFSVCNIAPMFGASPEIINSILEYTSAAYYLLMFLPSGAMLVFGQIERHGWHFGVYEYSVIEDSWLDRNFFAEKWAGVCLGLFIWYAPGFNNKSKTLAHERRHAEQFYKLGLAWPILYAAHAITLYFLFWDRHPYYDNYFEWDARKAAGQPLDIKWEKWEGSADRWIWW